jgi:hypothetical protein
LYANGMTPADRLLAWLIRANAVILLLAVVPVFFPPELMAAIHARFGLGTLPREPIVEYLTRSAAACYAMHGGVVWLLSTDVRAYRRLITRVYQIHLVFAATVFCIDVYAGLPWWWTVTEGGTIAGVAGVILTVNRRAERAVNPAG